MLEEIMDYVHNYFEYEKLKGNFVISSGELVCDKLKDGQYFKIVGSVFNDGVWSTKDALKDEEFYGEVWLLAVPQRVIDLAAEIGDWVAANKEVLQSPYQSESFGGYSYTKASGADNGGTAGWREVFGTYLNHWRKLA